MSCFFWHQRTAYPVGVEDAYRTGTHDNHRCWLVVGREESAGSRWEVPVVGPRFSPPCNSHVLHSNAVHQILLPRRWAEKLGSLYERRLPPSDFRKNKKLKLSHRHRGTSLRGRAGSVKIGSDDVEGGIMIWQNKRRNSRSDTKSEMCGFWYRSAIFLFELTPSVACYIAEESSTFLHKFLLKTVNIIESSFKNVFCVTVPMHI